MYSTTGYLPDGPVSFRFDGKCLPNKIIFYVEEGGGNPSFHLTRADVEALRDAVVAFLEPVCETCGNDVHEDGSKCPVIAGVLE